MLILAGTSNPQLATNLAKLLKVKLCDRTISDFKNGERRIHISTPVKNQRVIIVQAFSQPVDTMIIETLLLADALQRSGADKIELILTWMGYSLQDKVFSDGEPLSAKVIAGLITQSAVQKVYLLDLHNASIPGFFSIPTQNLSALPIFVDYIKKHYDLAQTVIASPDFGGLKRATLLANALNVPLVRIEKTRDLTTGMVAETNLRGSVVGKQVIVFDDVIVSGSTVAAVSKELLTAKVESVHYFATHGLFTSTAVDTLTKAGLTSVVITNSIAQTQLPNLIKVLDCGPILTEALN